MKIGILISQNDPETVWDAFRLGNRSLSQAHQVKAFLIDKEVESEEISDNNFDVREQMGKFIGGGGRILGCGTCIKVRQKEGSHLCPLYTLQDPMNVVEESDKISLFQPVDRSGSKYLEAFALL